MAGTLVGGSILSAFLQVLFDRIASREFVDFFRGQKLSDELLMRLKITIRSINRLLDDAEEKQITNRDVQMWLDDLKDAVYEADDLLDEIAYEGLRSEIEASPQTNNIAMWRNFLSSRSPFNKRIMRMKVKLKKILDRLKDLVEQKYVLGLGENIGEKQSLHKTPTTSLVDESGVFGRNNDKEALVKLLLSDNAYGRNLGVIPIVGMCGVGKTTLGQLVYNDSRVQEWFDLKTWVCVSEEFGVFKITKDILKEFGSKNCDTKTQNQLHLELKEKLMGKKYLLVLDDVWDAKYDDWDILLTPLKFGAQGSKIIVTTQSEKVASVLSTVPTYHLKGLTDDDCWFLFEKHAFDYGDSSAHPGLEGIGREIVRKCKGLPLAVKSLAGLLRSERDLEEWEKILRSNLWDLQNNNILPALRLSYHYLPSHLKRCFSYCSIFPKDYEFRKEEMVHLWMAEGFLIQLKSNQKMKEVGDEYFRDLVSRSFFQQSSSHPSCFVMHDLMNDLAKLVSGEFCYTLGDANGLKLAKKTRHLSYVRAKHGNLKEFEGTYETKFLRTFLLMEQSQELDHNENAAMHDLLPTLRRLRVLSLPQYSYVQELPDSIGNLKHLRYLNLFQASLKNLPRIIHALYNLQTLILRECKDLVELPNSIGKLKHLQHLDLFGTSIIKLPNCVIGLRNLETLILCQCKDLTVLPTNMGSLISLHHLDIRETNLKEMPLQMGNLKNLRILTRFINTGSRIKELGELQHLRGTLEIWNLQNVVDALDALTANLKGKKHLEDLQLRWHGDTDDAFHERDVLEQLQPHTNVEYISIIGYGGPTFPEWVGDSSFSNVVSLTLSECKRCSSLPPLGQLPSLKYLLVQALCGVVVIGTEFYGSCMNPFRNLEEFRFERMPHLQEWICSEGGAFPVLRELYIKQCPNMSKALPSHLPSLTTLEIEGCQQLAAALPTTPSICRLKLDDDSRDVLVTKLPSGLHGLRVDGFNPISSLLEGTERMGVPSTNLEDIEIRNCGSLVSFPLQMFSKLKSFQISECPNLESLDAYERSPENFTRSCLKISVCPDLTLLRLWNCSNVRSLPRCMHSLLPSLEILQLVNCPELVSFPEGGLPTKLQSLQIRNCRKLIAGRMEWNLQALQCLSHFSFGEYEDIESFPEKTLLPTTLITLGIWDLQNLKSLDYEGLQHLTSLTQMRISHCPDLQSMPEEGLPSSLSSLIISQCPLLERRCHNKGEDWSKISHIPDIDINWDS
uniref:Rx N-terminal domain-containing protein n=1 Tax=Salix viminalis TaxID=40686 RepID=A0A6N2LGL8_SALVM